jgi:hypothetical protein
MRTATLIVAVAAALSLTAPTAWALSEEVTHPKIFFPKPFDEKKAEQIHRALRGEKLGFQGGLISYWEPTWSTTLVYGGDTAALQTLLKDLSAVAGMRVKVSFSKDLSKETGSALRAGSWWVKYSHVTPDVLTVRINLAAKEIDPSQLELWAVGEAAGSVPAVKDAESGISVSVGTDEKTLVAKDERGKVAWQADVIKLAGAPGVGKPAVRSLSVKNGRVTAVYGKHSFADFDIRTGKLLSSGSD